MNKKNHYQQDQFSKEQTCDLVYRTFKSGNCVKNIEENNANKIPYGVKFLDDALYGIKKDDLVTISAYSGVGKTELTTYIAQQAAEIGNKVYFFALEASEGEIENRIIYRLAAQYYFADKHRMHFEVSYRLFINNKIDPLFFRYVDEAEKYAEKKYSNLNIIYRTSSDFNVEMFCNSYMTIGQDAKLIIVDHLNYFDLENDSEYQGITRITKKLRDMVLLFNIPIILVTQLNRADRRNKRIVPSMDDIHGTSNVPKIATTCIFLAKDEGSVMVDGKLPCYMRIDKNRIDGSLSRYVGVMKYNYRTNEYDTKYVVAKLKVGDTELTQLENEEKQTWML